MVSAATVWGQRFCQQKLLLSLGTPNVVFCFSSSGTKIWQRSVCLRQTWSVDLHWTLDISDSWTCATSRYWFVTVFIKVFYLFFLTLKPVVTDPLHGSGCAGPGRVVSDAGCSWRSDLPPRLLPSTFSSGEFERFTGETCFFPKNKSNKSPLPQTNSSPVPVSSTWESGMRSKSFQQHLKEESASRRRTLSSVMERSTSTTLRFCKDFYCRKCICSLLFLQQLIISFGLWFYEPCSVFFVCLFCSQLWRDGKFNPRCG